MNRKRKNILPWIGVLMLTCAMAGCGNQKGSRDKKPEPEEQTTAETGEEEEAAGTASAQEDDSPQYQHLESMMIEDYYGDHSELEVFVPAGSEYNDGFLSCYDQGFSFYASVYSVGLPDAEEYEMWEEAAKDQAQEWQDSSEYSCVQVGKPVQVGDDRYLIISADRLDFYGTPYMVKKINYIDMREEGKSVRWSLELSEMQQDDTTKEVVGEIAKFYGIDPDSLSVKGEWDRLDAQRQMEEQDLYEPGEGSQALEKVDGYQYMGKTDVAFDGGTVQCPVMLPMGRLTSVEEWRVSSDMHGVSVRIDCDKMYLQNHFALLEDHVDADCRIAGESGAKNIKRSMLMAMKDYNTAVYGIVTYEEPDGTEGNYNTVAEVSCYIKIKDTYLYSCNITLRSREYDTATDILLRELESAYGIDLSDYYYEKGAVSGGNITGKVTLAELLKEGGLIGCGDTTLPETVLWFNASYAALTYSNGWDWHLVGGIEPTEDNVDTASMLLQSSWSVWDRESALETVDSLKTKGHRDKCRGCMEQLGDWGLLEVDSKDFPDKLSERLTDENPGRYVIAYMMHQNGIEPEYIAAWDLCRVNQLYADYYLCGYMSYEEAMDASLENSLNLQKMYGSWEEMMDAYMLGYQFWQGDLAMSDDSPTLKRYHYYEMLHNMPDGPYTLDWDTQLKKSW